MHNEFVPWEEDPESPLKHLLYGSLWADARAAMHNAVHVAGDPVAANEWELIAKALKNP